MSGINIVQLRYHVIRPVLEFIDLWSPAAENLVLGTALTESRARHIRQIRGPAISIYQIEPPTFEDLRKWLARQGKLGERVDALRSGLYPSNAAVFDMQGNLHYATAMCRAYYRRVPEALPDANNPLGMARYWKVHYNTHLGAGEIEKARPFFEIACSAESGAGV